MLLLEYQTQYRRFVSIFVSKLRKGIKNNSDINLLIVIIVIFAEVCLLWLVSLPPVTQQNR